MQFRAAAALEAEIGTVKQIKLSNKRGFGPTRSFGHGRQAAQIGRQPMDDQTRIRQWSRAQNQTCGSFNHQGILP
jgi:hypothetical protein